MKKIVFSLILVVISQSYVIAKQSAPAPVSAPTVEQPAQEPAPAPVQDPSKAIAQTADTAMASETTPPLMKTLTPEVKQFYSQSEEKVKEIELIVREVQKVRSELRDMYYKLNAEMDSFLQKSGLIVGRSKEIYSDLVHDSIQKLVKEHGLRTKNAQ